jgi:hypothetical protein
MLAYLRHRSDEWILVLVPLISSDSAAHGFRVELPKGAPVEWVNLFTGDVHHALDSGLEWRGWDRFPVAMLIGR